MSIYDVGRWVQRHIAETITGIWTFSSGLIGNLTTNSLTSNLNFTSNTIQAGGSDSVVDINANPKGTGRFVSTIFQSNKSVDADFDNTDVISTGIVASYGMLAVKETVTGRGGLFRLENQTITTIEADSSFSLTKDAAFINLYWETDQFKIQNNSGVSNYNLTVGLFAV